MPNTGIWITGPTRTPLPHRLTAVVPVLDAPEYAAFGVNFETINPEAVDYPHGVCATRAERTTSKLFSGIDYIEDSAVVTLYAGVECGFMNYEQHAPLAQRRLELGESHGLEIALRTKVLVTGTAVTIAATTLIGRFAAGEAAALADYQAELLVHVSPIVATYLAAADIIKLDGQGVLRTISGSRVVIGTGYTATTAPAGGVASAAGQEWVFFTGELLIHRGDLEVHMGSEPETNNHRAIAEGIYTLTVDGPIFGALLTLEA